jgi:hypothetical protein
MQRLLFLAWTAWILVFALLWRNPQAAFKWNNACFAAVEAALVLWGVYQGVRYYLRSRVTTSSGEK